MPNERLYGFVFKPLSAELSFSTWFERTTSRIQLVVDAVDQNILFINEKFAVCDADHWRLTANRNRVPSVGVTIYPDNASDHELRSSENSEFVKYWKLENCVGYMTVAQADDDSSAYCDLQVWLPSINLRILRSQLLNDKLPAFISVTFRTPLAHGTLDYGIAPDGSDKVLKFDDKDRFQVPIHSVDFGYKLKTGTSDSLL